MAEKKYLDDNGLLYVWNKIKSNFVLQESGKGLSTNDLTNELKNKYDTVVTKVDELTATGGEPNVIETIKVNGTIQTVTDKAVNITVPTKVSDLNNDAGYLTADTETKEIQELSSEISVWSLNDGIYKLPSNCIVNYSDSSATRITTASYLMVVTVSSSKKYFYIFGGDASQNYIYSGYSSSSAGAIYDFDPTKDYLTSYTETDPVFSASPSAGITNANITSWNNKAETSAIPTNNNQLANGAGYQTASDVNAIIESVIGAAPDALNTLDELAQALGDDPNFATTMTTELAKKVNDADIVAITNAEIDTITAS